MINNSSLPNMYMTNNQIMNVAKRTLKCLILIFASVFVLNSCNKKCNCTNEPCPCFPFTISVYANANNSAEGSFATKDMDEFYLVRTNESYVSIDSIKMNFTDLFSSQYYNKIFRFSAENFSNVTDIKPYNFIIKNNLLATADTISSITYSETLQSVLCNVCTNCDDEYLDCIVFEDINFEFDCVVQDKAEIVIKRRPN